MKSDILLKSQRPQSNDERAHVVCNVCLTVGNSVCSSQYTRCTSDILGRSCNRELEATKRVYLDISKSDILSLVRYSDADFSSYPDYGNQFWLHICVV